MLFLHKRFCQFKLVEKRILNIVESFPEFSVSQKSEYNKWWVLRFMLFCKYSRPRWDTAITGDLKLNWECDVRCNGSQSKILKEFWPRL